MAVASPYAVFRASDAPRFTAAQPYGQLLGAQACRRFSSGGSIPGGARSSLEQPRWERLIQGELFAPDPRP